MIVAEEKPIVYIDVDDTLVLWDRTPESNAVDYRISNKHVRALKEHKLRNHTVIVWSAGGVSWAKRIVGELGLEPYVDFVLPKPNWYYDDRKAEGILPECNRVFFEQLPEVK